MKSKIFLFIITMSFLSSTVFAVTSEQNIKVNNNHQRSLKSKSLKKSSYDNRVDKSASITAGMGVEQFEFSQFINADLFLNPDTLVSLRFSYADDSDNRYDDETQILSTLQIKQFVSNSFYFKAGFYYRDYEERNARPLLFSSQTNTYTLKDAGLTFSLGNQWSFNKFTIGCDWFGLSSRLVKISEEGNKDLFNLNDEKVSISLVSFYVGMSF